MTIIVRSLTAGASYYLPFYRQMPLGMFVTHIAAPALGCRVEKNGDVHDMFLLNREQVFKNDNKKKVLGDVLQDGAELYHSICCLGHLSDCLVGNGCNQRPTKHHLTLLPSGGGDGISSLSVGSNEDAAAGAPVFKKRKLVF